MVDSETINRPSTWPDLLEIRPIGDRLRRVKELISGSPDRVVLWVGAGFSAHFAGLPTLRQFLSRLLRDPSIPDSCFGEAPRHAREAYASLVDHALALDEFVCAAELVEGLLGEHFDERIRTTFHVRDSFRHPLGAFRVPTIATTNFDELLEIGMPWYDVVLPEDPIARHVRPGPKIIKLHGTLGRSAQPVMSASRYALAYTRAMHAHLAYLFQQRHVVFLGCSLGERERFLQTARELRRNGVDTPDHFAIIDVQPGCSSDRKTHPARVTAERLARGGILAIPYIPGPGGDFSLFGQILDYLNPARSGPDLLHTVRAADVVIERGNLYSARELLEHAAEVAVRNGPRDQRSRSVAEALGRFGAALLARLQAGSTTAGFARLCGSSRPDVLIHAAAELAPTVLSVQVAVRDFLLGWIATARPRCAEGGEFLTGFWADRARTSPHDWAPELDRIEARIGSLRTEFDNRRAERRRKREEHMKRTQPPDQ